MGVDELAGLGGAGVDGGEVGVPEESDKVDGEEAVLGGYEPEVEDLGGDEDAPVADERRDVRLCGEELVSRCVRA